mmetsp:Transcript_6258/g.9476  ORF Transcript_6258/g.9476 Transcript_6258/m.9476 type:complete len:257 (-) Transcript_6258:372-1142(-)
MTISGSHDNLVSVEDDDDDDDTDDDNGGGTSLGLRSSILDVVKSPWIILILCILPMTIPVVCATFFAYASRRVCGVLLLLLLLFLLLFLVLASSVLAFSNFALLVAGSSPCACASACPCASPSTCPCPSSPPFSPSFVVAVAVDLDAFFGLIAKNERNVHPSIFSKNKHALELLLSLLTLSLSGTVLPLPPLPLLPLPQVLVLLALIEIALLVLAGGISIPKMTGTLTPPLLHLDKLLASAFVRALVNLSLSAGWR